MIPWLNCPKCGRKLRFWFLGPVFWRNAFTGHFCRCGWPE